MHVSVGRAIICNDIPGKDSELKKNLIGKQFERIDMFR